jgi:hypothetical protein
MKQHVFLPLSTFHTSFPTKRQSGVFFTTLYHSCIVSYETMLPSAPTPTLTSLPLPYRLLAPFLHPLCACYDELGTNDA